MTNAEKYKTAKERWAALGKFCQKFQRCEECPAYKRSSDENICKFDWLELEAPMTAKEVADILAEHSKWRRGEGKYAGSEVLGIVLERAVELLRGSSNEQK